MNQHQFFTGEIFDAYHWFGAHIEQNAVVFRTFAPNASRITLTGACNGWTETDQHQDGRSGFWEVSVQGTQAAQLYKYRIYADEGSDRRQGIYVHVLEYVVRIRHGDP